MSEDDDELLHILSRLAVQRSLLSREQETKAAITTPFSSWEKSSLPSSPKVNIPILFPQNQATEYVEMVDSNGIPLGSLPRDLVHRFNLLHRGVGILVAKVDGDIYVHRRTDTKRIFPGLYDMFVGGVSGAEENARITAEREVAEELGLRRSYALSDPLFQCTVCTDYNRCVVTCFQYVYQEGLDHVTVSLFPYKSS